MNELRRDPIFERVVVISNNEYKFNGKCPHCLGNENVSNSVVLALVQDGNILKRVYDNSDITNWCVKVSASEDPIVTQTTEQVYTEKPFLSEPAYGYHYEIIVTPDHKNPCKFPVEQWINILVTLQDRIKWLYTKKGVTYVSAFMNNLRTVHPHIDIITFSSIPPLIEKEAISIQKYINENGSCPICDIVKNESNGPRQIFSTKHFLAVCPWASTQPYRFSIIPIKHTLSFTKITQKEIDDLALIIKVTLGALNKVLSNDEFNLIFRLSPEKKHSKQFHWYVDVFTDRNELSILNEFGIYINRLKPEEAAKQLAQACRGEYVALMHVI